MHPLRTALAAAAIAAIASAAAIAYPSTLNLKLYAQNRPGKTGTATLQQLPGGVGILVEMAGGQNGTQTVHIHTGSCASPNPIPRYTLTDIVDGSSRTMVPGISLDDLLKGQYVIDVHESSADSQRYVAC